ncbi:aminopeptidase [Lysinibacillus sp. 2017]|uniref:aminopeptidase n=1 Tax=unclassified Lysinibacillus TaxID=2636778 RepID=UPI000D526414|nr:MULTISPECIES: aminopeptidase [unclassified Lysinibacillus]AWE08028.1 aminopeptidase [Lysinibacillus sp. 2017]TGN34895.1 aminopeptidase [Lysinibacillus sp. S2017]
MKIQELEYRGINLMDVVGTVEIAIDADRMTVHVFDTQQIVEPEYHFQTKSYTLSEGFFKLAIVLKQKQFFLESKDENLEQWIDLHTWIFYCSNQSIKKYGQGEMTVIQKEQFKQWIDQPEASLEYYPKYFLRLK